MTIPNYIIKTPVYNYAKSYYYVDILDGDYKGIRFNFSKIEVVDNNLKFIYNILRAPYDIEADSKLEELIGKILLDIIERGNYELNTE